MEQKFDLQPFTFEGVSTKRPLIMAGPCSAESETQVLDTAKRLAANNVKIFRAGIWKPRTRPGQFEGLGTTALPWMKMVKEETKMYTATEVANAKHVYEALKWGIDILWIGARTTANPFSVQEIADALRGVDIAVMVKNPVNPDLELWMGALERLYMCGITRLAACHRGFSIFEKQEFRNDPNWQIPIALKTRMPNMPVITDPSHICGNRTGLLSVSQTAMDLNFDGLIIETHPDPDKAWSDAKQQITPEALSELLSKLVIREAEENVQSSEHTLEDLRQKIDKIDDSILDIFEKRMIVAEQIGQYKKDHNLSILQSKRWEEILQKRIAMSAKKNLSAEFTDTIFKAIHQESINHQTKIMNS